MDIRKIKTLAHLRSNGYKYKSIKDELRLNLVNALADGKKIFQGIRGFDDTVLPQLQTAILSRHNILLLGLRGQAKTKIARLMVQLLDEYIPYIAGSELFDDPFKPISRYGKEKIEEYGDDTAIDWLHRDDRYAEKLATPDVSVADLIGDVDPIKAATLKLTYADDRVIHFGMIPRSNRHIFVINELPDLQARIQVALFNILQEGDIQVRGFKLRLPLDIEFVFTANPEDYTNRGSIVTPLKDRIGSQIITHYPKSIETAAEITLQEARILPEQKNKIIAPMLLSRLIEQIAFEARQSEFIDQKSGISARLTIAAWENIYSVAERRMLINKEKNTTLRIADLTGIIPSITGKVELVYEGEMEGISAVAHSLIGKAIRREFTALFPDPEKSKKKKTNNPYEKITEWFGAGNELDILNNCNNEDYEKKISSVPGLKELVSSMNKKTEHTDNLLLMEFVLHGLAEYSQLSKKNLERGITFSDLMSGMFRMTSTQDDEQ